MLLDITQLNSRKGFAMDYVYHIDKCDAVKSEYYGTWYVRKCENVKCGLVPQLEVVFRAKTRKECIEFAKANCLNVAYVGTGRIVRGHTW